MPIPIEDIGSSRIGRRACEWFWLYREGSSNAANVSVTIDRGTPFNAATGTNEVNNTQGWQFLVAGPSCPSPGTAHVLKLGTHLVEWTEVDGSEVHSGTGYIEIT